MSLLFNRVVIGIDPDLNKNGVAILKDNILQVFNVSIDDLVFKYFDHFNYLKSNAKDFIVIIEAGWLIKTLYRRFLAFDNNLIISKIAMQVGENNGTGKVLQSLLTAKNFEPFVVPPINSFGKKLSQQKLIDALNINKIIPTFKQSNQDQRDAAVIVLNYINNLYDKYK